MALHVTWFCRSFQASSTSSRDPSAMLASYGIHEVASRLEDIAALSVQLSAHRIFPVVTFWHILVVLHCPPFWKCQSVVLKHKQQFQYVIVCKGALTLCILEMAAQNWRARYRTEIHCSHDNALNGNEARLVSCLLSSWIELLRWSHWGSSKQLGTGQGFWHRCANNRFCTLITVQSKNSAAHGTMENQCKVCTRKTQVFPVKHTWHA